MKFWNLLFVLLLSSCSTLDVTTTPIEKLPLNISDPAPIQLEQITFLVLTKENAEATLETMEKAGKSPVIFGLTPDDYRALSVNVDSIKNYLILQKEILLKYREYYEK